MGSSKSTSKRARSSDSENGQVRCVCGATDEAEDTGNAETWITCGSCGCRQHNICMGISTTDGALPEEYECEQCAPDSHRELIEATSQGINLWENRRKSYREEMSEETPKHRSKKARKRANRQNATHGDNMDGADDTIVNDSISSSAPLTDECHHYTSLSEVPWDIQKYWQQRHSIFSCYDLGIYMTDDAWFGVTPEPIANKIAEDLAALTDPSRTILIDIFGGVGGNAIAFALSNRWEQVIAVEKNPSVIACAQHNATLYGVSELITWVNEDCFSYLESISSSIDPSKTVVFASPPWGGPGYTSDEVFNLKTMMPYSLKMIHDVCTGMDSALYLPRTSDLRQLAKLAPEGKKLEVVQYCIQGASKALVAYIPATSTVA